MFDIDDYVSIAFGIIIGLGSFLIAWYEYRYGHHLTSRQVLILFLAGCLALIGVVVVLAAKVLTI